MITGPSIGPAMVLMVLMRWPSLIAIGAIGGAGAQAYQYVELPPPIAAEGSAWLKDVAVQHVTDLSPAGISAATAFVSASVMKNPEASATEDQEKESPPSF